MKTDCCFPFGLTQEEDMFEVLAEAAHLEYMSFRDFDEAVAWVLDVPEGAT